MLFSTQSERIASLKNAHQSLIIRAFNQTPKRHQVKSTNL